MRIGVFGGTFDPPHRGHTEIAGHILDSGLVDKVLFVPAYTPPHKTDKPVTDAVHRMEMLKLALEKHPQFDISDIEYVREKSPSYTFDTMMELEKIMLQDKLLLLIGSDSLRQLHTWHKPRELVKKWELIVYPRNGETATLEELENFWTKEEADALLRNVIKMPFIEISSTEIRKRIANNGNVDTLIDPEVTGYINLHGLYRQRQNKINRTADY